MMTTGERIKERRKEIGISADVLAEAIGVSRSTVFRYENGFIEKMPMQTLEPIAKVLRTTVEFLMGWTDESNQSGSTIIPLPESRPVPLLGAIACGEPILAEDNIEAYVNVNSDIPADFALRCQGDSMINARIFDGDIVYIRRQADVDDGEIAAVLIDTEATLKRVHKFPNKLVLSPCNPMYDDLVYAAEQLSTIRILGKAVAFTSTIR